MPGIKEEDAIMDCPGALCSYATPAARRARKASDLGFYPRWPGCLFCDLTMESPSVSLNDSLSRKQAALEI